MDRLTALKVLGLDEGASPETIEQAYGILLRRKMQQQREGRNEAEDELFRKYSEAYATLKGDVAVEQKGAWKRIANFLSYRKVPILIGLAVAVMIGSLTWAAFFRIKPDLTLQIAGEIYTGGIGLDRVSAAVKDALPGVPAIQVGTTPLRHDATDPTSLNNSNKIFIDMAMGRVDAFLVDRWLFDKYRETGIFQPLEAMADRLGAPASAREGLSGTTREDPAERLYGLDVTRSKLLYDAGVVGDVKILVVLSKAPHPENAEALAAVLLPEAPDWKPAPTAEPD